MKTYKLQPEKNSMITTDPMGKVIDFYVDEQEIRNLIKNNPELLTPTPTHKRKYFVPKVGEDYYVITSYGKVLRHIRGSDYDLEEQMTWITGNAFKTEEDGYVELNRRQALVRIWNNYDDKYSWDIDWEDRTVEKHNISYDHIDKEITKSGLSWVCQSSTELPYFKSAEDRNQFVKKNESDILTVINIKK